jgi:hypothetical protein
MNPPSQNTTSLLRTVSRFGAIIALGLATLQTSHAAMLHHWDFNTDGTDSISGSNVTLVGAATISGGALNIPGGATFVDYGSVNLAATLANNPTLTVECWYTQNALTAWSKVWMFGFDTGAGEPALSYIDYTPYTGLGGNPPKIDFDPNDNPELNAPGGPALNAGQQYHAVTVYDAGQNRMSMWINGVLIATNTMGGESIQSLGFNTGRFGSGFFYADQELTGAINDVRIYSNPLGALQIAVNFAAGPDTVVSSYVPSAVHLNAGSTTLLGGQTEQVDVTGDFGSLLGVEVTVAATNWISSNPGAVTVDQTGLITAVGAGNANISAKVAGVTGSIGISVSAVQPTIAQDLQPLSVFVGSSVGLTVGAQGGNLSYFWYKNNTLVPSQTTATFSFPAIALSDAGNYSVTVSNQVGTANSSTVSVSVAQQTLDHRYSMDDATVTDSIGGANGSPVNNITFSGGQANFPGTLPSGGGGDYIALPGGLISGYSSVTFEIWATIQPNGNWNQICAFGDQSGTAGNTYLAVIPHSGAGPNDYRMTIKTLGNERATSGAAPVDTGVPVHLVAVFSADTSNEVLYANGRIVSTRSTTIDIANVNNLNSWLGRSLFDGDAGLKGSIDEFRIWNGPLTPLHIAVNDGLGPNSVNSNPGSFLGLTSISVANTTMVGGTSQQGTALANFANISNVPFNSQVTNWVSSNTNVVTVNASGLITAVGSGTSSVSATALGSTTNVTISVLAVQPTISQQPAAQTRFVGGSAQFTVVAAGGQLTYQWLKNGTAIANATTNPLALAGLVSGDAADYRVVITNSAGSITSAIAHLTVSALPAGYPGAVMADGPVAYWRLDESSGTTMVDSYNLNNGVYSGAVTQGTPGLIFGGADASATFNSGATVNGTATVPFNASLNPSTFTVEFWANPLTTLVGGQYVVSLQDRASGRRGYAVQFDNITSYSWDFTIGTNNTQFISVSSPPPRVMAGNLYHIVAAYDGTTARLYVNGTLMNSFVTPYQPVVTPVNLTIASRNGNNYTHAVLDDVALYNYALSPAQIANHYGLGRSGTLAATIVSNPVPASIKSVVGVPQSFRAMASGQAPLALQWLKNGVPVPGATSQTLTLPSVQLSDAGSYSLRASNAVAGAVTSAPAVLTVASQPFLVHRWSFDDGTDSVSGSNATLFGSAAYSGTGQLVLSDGGHLVSYANVNIGPTFASSPSLTFEGWYVDNAAANWAKVWMFGLSTANYIDYTPHRGDANHQASMSFNPLGGEVNTANLPFEPPVLTPGQVYHVVAAYDSVGNKMNLYLDGVLVATNNMAGSDLTLIQADQGLIGASLFGDPDVAGSIDELRVWRGALSPAQVAATHFAGPSSVPNFNVTLTAQLSGGNLIVTWPAGTLLQAPSVTGPWTPVSGAAPPSYSVPISGAPIKFYRVQVQ